MSPTREELVNEVTRLRVLDREHRRISEDTESSLRELRGKITVLEKYIQELIQKGGPSPEDCVNLLERVQNF